MYYLLLVFGRSPVLIIPVEVLLDILERDSLQRVLRTGDIHVNLVLWDRSQSIFSMERHVRIHIDNVVVQCSHCSLSYWSSVCHTLWIAIPEATLQVTTGRDCKTMALALLREVAALRDHPHIESPWCHPAGSCIQTLVEAHHQDNPRKNVTLKVTLTM